MKLNKKILIIPIITIFLITILLLSFALLFGNNYTLKTGKNTNFSIQLKSNKEKTIKITLKDSNSIVFTKLNNEKVPGDFLFIIKDSNDKIIRKGLIHKDGDTTIKKLDKGNYKMIITYTGKKEFKLEGQVGLKKVEKQKYATLTYGTRINNRLEELLGESINYYSKNSNTSVTEIKIAKKIDPKYMTDEYDISSTDSLKPIYMWVEDRKTIYFYSELPIEFNKSSYGAFTGLRGLNNIKDLKYFGTEKVNSFEGLFRGCVSLSDISALSYWDTSSVENMDAMFDDCSSLININPLLAFDTNSLKKIGMFLSDTPVKDISVLRYFDTSKVEYLMGTFADTVINDFSPISGWDVSNVDDMAYLFSGTKIKSIEEIKKWDVGRVTDMSYIFAYCDNLEDISGLKNWKPIKLIDFEGAFKYTKIKNIDALNNWDVSNINSMEKSFYDCRKLTNIDGLSEWKTSKLTNLEGTFAFTSFKDTKPLANWDVSNVESLEEAFGHSKINNMDGFKNWNVSKVKSFSETFEYTNIKDLKGLESWDVSSGNDFRSMFEGCSDLKDTTAINTWKLPSGNKHNAMFKKIGGELPSWAI